MDSNFKRLNKICIFVPIWLIINTVIGMIISFFLSIAFDYPFLTLFFMCQVSTHIISTMAAATGYFLGYRLGNHKLIVALPFTIAGTLLATIISMGVSYLFSIFLFQIILFDTLAEYIINLGIPIFSITVIITITASIIERLKVDRLRMSDEMEELRETKNRMTGGISILEKGTYHLIEFTNIVYLSSHGKKTLIHTDDKEYEYSKLLKDIEEMLPEEAFMRIHKQYIVNINFISRLQYFSGGRYLVYLNDEEENTLPVGRNSAGLLKVKLGIDQKDQIQ